MIYTTNHLRSFLLSCSILNRPYDTSSEADLLYSLIVKAKFENNRYQKPKKQPKSSTKHVDFFWCENFSAIMLVRAFGFEHKGLDLSVHT